MYVFFLSILTDAFFIALLIWCSISDMKKRLVPNLAITVMLCLGIAHLWLMTQIDSAWWAYPAGVIFAIPYLIVWLKGGIGAGDVKLLMTTGLYLGLLKMLAALVFMLPMLIVVVLRSWVKHKTFKCMIPFAPVIAIGSVGSVLLGYLCVLM